MKRLIILTICVCCLFLTTGCWINKAAYGIQHSGDPAPNPTSLEGATIVVQSSNARIQGVIDLAYEAETDIVHYVRNDNGKFIQGVVKYSDVTIEDGDGYLKYDKVKKEWYFVLGDLTYEIYQNNYRKITISGTDSK